MTPEELAQKMLAVFGGECWRDHWSLEKDCFSYFLKAQRVDVERRWKHLCPEEKLYTDSEGRTFYVQASIGFKLLTGKGGYLEIQQPDSSFDSLVVQMRSLIDDPWPEIMAHRWGRARDLHGNVYRKIRREDCLRYYFDRASSLEEFKKLMAIVLEPRKNRGWTWHIRMAQQAALRLGLDYRAIQDEMLTRLEKSLEAARILAL